MASRHISALTVPTPQTTNRRTLLLSTAAFGFGAMASSVALTPRRTFARQLTPTTGTPAVGGVYAMTNSDGVGNGIVAFSRGDDGHLSYLATTPTGGQGTGRRNARTLEITSGFDSLASNHSLIHDRDHQLLLGVNAGDGTVSSLRIDDIFGVSAVDTVPAGTAPNSLAVSNGVLYVSLSGSLAWNESPSLTAFHVGDDGSLTPIDGSTRTLGSPDMVEPSDIVFSSDGKHLLMVDTMANLLSVFPIAGDGMLGDAITTPSAGTGPFSASMLDGGVVLISETQGGAEKGFGKASLSTYSLADDGSLTVISGQVTNGRTASCWAAATPDGSRAFTANTADGTVSSYALADDGTLTLVSAVAAQETTTVAGSSAPIDVETSPDGTFLYQLWGGLGAIIGYRIGAHGGLAPIDGGIGAGLPQLGSQGIVVI